MPKQNPSIWHLQSDWLAPLYAAFVLDTSVYLLKYGIHTLEPVLKCEYMIDGPKKNLGISSGLHKNHTPIGVDQVPLEQYLVLMAEVLVVEVMKVE